jgi:hypothetical protein
MRPNKSVVGVFHPHDPDVTTRQIREEMAVFLETQFHPRQFKDDRFCGEEGWRSDQPGIKRCEPVNQGLTWFEYESQERPGSET